MQVEFENVPIGSIWPHDTVPVGMERVPEPLRAAVQLAKIDWFKTEGEQTSARVDGLWGASAGEAKVNVTAGIEGPEAMAKVPSLTPAEVEVELVEEDVVEIEREAVVDDTVEVVVEVDVVTEVIVVAEE